MRVSDPAHEQSDADQCRQFGQRFDLAIRRAGQSLGALADTTWRLVGAGDFNADGTPDLLWHHQVTGQTYVWYMTGATVTGGQTLGTVADTTWRLVGAGDFAP